MPKHLIQDMVRHPTQKSRNQVVTEKRENQFQFKENTVKKTSQYIVTENTVMDRAKSRSRYMLWCLAFVSVVFCLFAFSFLFSKAEISVDLKTKDIVLNENLFASNDSNNSGLFFDLMSISDEETLVVNAAGEKDAKEYAKGVVVIYNAFNSSTQALSVDTRLEGSNGKIYKTQTKIVVPGMKKDGTPGSVEVKVYGSEAGEEYNSLPLDFKILGFKGTPKYSKFYGRSKGEIIGGFKGKIPAIRDTDKETAIKTLRANLQAKLFKKATDQIPGGFILFKGAVFLSIDDSNILSSISDDGRAILTEKGTLYGVLFNEQKLTKKIAENNIEKYDGSEVYIPNIGNIAFTLANKDNISFVNLKEINFTLSGSVKIVWSLDINKFIADLSGKPKKDFGSILSQYPNIDSALLKISFPWIKRIPDKIENIKVTINNPR